MLKISITPVLVKSPSYSQSNLFLAIPHRSPFDGNLQQLAKLVRRASHGPVGKYPRKSVTHSGILRSQ